MTYVATMFSLVAGLVSWMCLLGAVARVLTSFTVLVVLIGLVFSGQLLPVFAVGIAVLGFHKFGTTELLSLMVPPI